jgi:hypothetical protein
VPGAPAPPPSSTTYQSNQKLKYLEWTKLNLININGTVWGQLGKDNKEEYEEEKKSLFNESIVSKLSEADVFTAIESTFAQKPTALVPQRKRKVVDIVELLDPRKAQNMSKSILFLKNIYIETNYI